MKDFKHEQLWHESREREEKNPANKMESTYSMRYPYCQCCGQKEWNKHFALSESLLICKCGLMIIRDGPGDPDFQGEMNFACRPGECNSNEEYQYWRSSPIPIQLLIKNAIEILERNKDPLPSERPSLNEHDRLDWHREHYQHNKKLSHDENFYISEFFRLADALTGYGNWDEGIQERLPGSFLNGETFIHGEFSSDQIDKDLEKIWEETRYDPWRKTFLNLCKYCLQHDLLAIDEDDLRETA